MLVPGRVASAVLSCLTMHTACTASHEWQQTTHTRRLLQYRAPQHSQCSMRFPAYHAHQPNLLTHPTSRCFVNIERDTRNRQIVTKMAARASAVDSKPAVMVNSCSGKMGHATAEAVVRAGLALVPYSFTGASEGVAVSRIGIEGIPVELVPLEERQQAFHDIQQRYPNLVIVDYTLPSAVNGNARFYCENNVPFVMGTTGGDVEQMYKDVEATGGYAVIAPNMGKQVVAFQAMIELLAGNFPGAFSGYTLSVTESHQRTKADTSGTAKAVVASMKQLGLHFNEAQIRKVRQANEQMEVMKVPKNALDGHAFHTYRLTSPGGDVAFEFQHNVCGRTIYAEGTVDACLFLHRKVTEQSEQRIFNMVDVLRAGAMR